MKALFYIIFLHVILGSNCARILAGFPVDSISHIHSTAAYLKRLADDGHEITVLHYGKMKKVELNHPNINTYYSYMESDEDVITFVNSFLWKKSSHSVEPPIILVMNDKIVHQFIDDNSDSLKYLLNQRWDLIVVEQLFNPLTYAIATYHKRMYGTPYLQISSSHPLESDAIASGLGRSWAAKMSLFIPIPNDSNDIYEPGNFMERVVNFFEHFAEWFLHSFAHLWTFSAIRRIGIENFRMKSLRDESSLYFSDHFRGFEASPLSHDFQLVGAYCFRSSRLPDDLETFVGDINSKGTIYIAFGSIVRWASAPKYVIDAIFGALNELSEYRVIISSKGIPDTIKMRDHVKVMDWAPQVDILADNRTKVFISHGGLKSVKEAICGKTPVLYIPLFAEQAHNARQMTKLGIGSLLNKYNLNKEIVLKELKKLLENPSYQQKMNEFNSYYLDNPVSNLDFASHLTNRVIRKNGKNIWFKIKGQFLSYFQWLYLYEFVGIVVLLWILSSK